MSNQGYPPPSDPYSQAGQPAGYPQAPQGYAAAPFGATPKTNTMAIVSLILGIVWIFGIASIVAVILGMKAKKEIREAPPTAPQTGGGMATAGVILGWIGSAGALLYVVVVVIFIGIFGSAATTLSTIPGS
jgi:hypothetical protein